mmetsp:Transcript_56812/g.151629  ORF Transcript_56812/g.151629 Transcript_56812/m.151629 type:complete len:247 (-) Transcript_56812:79-819(-)
MGPDLHSPTTILPRFLQQPNILQARDPPLAVRSPAPLRQLALHGLSLHKQPLDSGLVLPPRRPLGALRLEQRRRAPWHRVATRQAPCRCEGRQHIHRCLELRHVSRGRGLGCPLKDGLSLGAGHVVQEGLQLVQLPEIVRPREQVVQRPRPLGVRRNTALLVERPQGPEQGDLRAEDEPTQEVVHGGGRGEVTFVEGLVQQPARGRPDHLSAHSRPAASPPLLLDPALLLESTTYRFALFPAKNYK